MITTKAQQKHAIEVFEEDLSLNFGPNQVIYEQFPLNCTAVMPYLLVLKAAARVLTGSTRAYHISPVGFSIMAVC